MNDKPVSISAQASSPDDLPLFLTEGTEARLGLTREQIGDMGLRDFVEHCYDRGIVVQFGLDGIAPGLTVDFAPEKEAANG